MLSAVKHRSRQFRKLMKLASSKGYRHGLPFGVAAAVEHHALLKGLKLATLVDIGANVGQFSLLARTLHPDVRIHAFEPLPRPASRYSRIFEHDPLTTLHRCAIGPESVVSSMYVS